MRALVRRTGALLAVSSAVLHGISLGSAMNPWIAVLTVAMLSACLYCAYELWTRDTVRSWVLVAVMNLAMIGVHLPMTGAHHHSAGGVIGPVSTPILVATPMQLATVVALVEVSLAATVLFFRTRALVPGLVTPCQSGAHDCGGTTGRPAGRNLDRLPEPS